MHIRGTHLPAILPAGPNNYNQPEFDKVVQPDAVIWSLFLFLQNFEIKLNCRVHIAKEIAVFFINFSPIHDTIFLKLLKRDPKFQLGNVFSRKSQLENHFLTIVAVTMTTKTWRGLMTKRNL